MARFGELLLLLLNSVAQFSELAIELLVVQPQQNGGESERARNGKQHSPPAREHSAVRGFRLHTRDAAARAFGRSDHLAHQGFFHAGRGSHGRRGEREDRDASARGCEFFGAVRAGSHVRFELFTFGVVQRA